MDEVLIKRQVVMRPGRVRKCERICGCGQHGSKAELLAARTRGNIQPMQIASERVDFSF